MNDDLNETSETSSKRDRATVSSENRTDRQAPPEAVRPLPEEQLERRKRQTAVSSGVGRRPAADKLGALCTLERVSGFGPVKFREMHDAGVDPREAIERPESLPFGGRTGDKVREAVRALSPAEISAGRYRAEERLKRAEDCAAAILVHGDAEYPKHVYASNNPVPVLYVRGDPMVWTAGGSVAVVGSRNTRDPYASRTRKFATVAARKGLTIVSGFALGADSIGHAAARDADGSTVCVMPCGLDKVFPPENRSLWKALLAYPGAVFVSEFAFGQRASSLRLRKRNKLIVAFAQGVLVAQSANDGGAMNAYRFGREQRKPVATFEPDGSKDTTGNAVIGEDLRTGGRTFDLSADESQYEAWLDGFSPWL